METAKLIFVTTSLTTSLHYSKVVCHLCFYETKMSRILEDKDENEVFVTSAVLDEALKAITKVVPAKFKHAYEKQNFCEWRKRKK